MINVVWMVLIVAGVAVGAVRSSPEKLTESLMNSAQMGVETIFGLVGIMVFWLGMMRIAERAGLVTSLASLMQPFLSRFFPEIPRNHPALGAVTLSISANLLGAGQAATPLGLKAMQELEALNPSPGAATNAMCTFLALNTSGLTLIPTTVIAVRAAAGSAAPAEIVGTTIFATACSTTVALLVDWLFRQRRRGGAR